MSGKNQHFVPRFYLKRIAHHDKLIGVCLTKSNTIENHRAIKHQCSRNNSYNRDIDALLERIEESHSIFLSGMVRGAYRSGVSKEHRQLGIGFVALMWARNLHGVDTQQKITDLYTVEKRQEKEQVLTSFDQKGTPADDTWVKEKVDHIDEKIEGVLKRYEALKHPLVSYKHTKNTIADLGMIVLENNNNQPFLSSDNPVAAYNLLYQDVVQMSTRGQQSVGLTLFVPLSEKLGIFLYDKSVYKMTVPNGGTVQITPSDARQLNDLTITNAYECLYFESFTGGFCQKIVAKMADLRTERKVSYTTSRGATLVCELFPNMQIRLSFLTIPKDIFGRRVRLGYSRSEKCDPDYIVFLEARIKEVNHSKGVFKEIFSTTETELLVSGNQKPETDNRKNNAKK